MAARFAFAYYSTHGGRNEVAQFSITHNITGDAVWVTALVLMAFGEVLARVLVLQVRRVRQPAEDRSVELPRSETALDQAVPEHQLRYGDVRRPSQPEPASFSGLGVVG